MKNIKVFEDFSSTVEEGHDHKKNYMFFQHLHTIKDAIEDILSMDQSEIDDMLSNGHNWALDHMATSVDDIEEVYHFLKNRVGVESEEIMEPEEITQVEIIEEPGSPEMEDDSDDDSEED